MTQRSAKSTEPASLRGTDGEPSVDQFSSELRPAGSRMTALRVGRLDEPCADHPLGGDAVYSELAAAREKLRVAEEELHRQRAELAIALEIIEVERHRYQELFDLAPDAYFITDEEGLVRECNAAAATLLGLAPQLLVARPLSSFIDVEARREFRVQLENLERGQQTLQWRSELRGRDGTTIPIAISVAPIRQRGSVGGLRWLIRDDSAHDAAHARLLQISEEMAARAMERKAQLDSLARLSGEVDARERQRGAAALGGHSYADLLGIVSHEVRTPLAAAHGYIELLRRGLRGTLTATQASDIESIALCHEHLLRVLDNALATARLDSGHLELSLAPVPVDAVLSGLRAYIQPDVEAKHIDYAYRPGDPQVAALADRGKLHQIMLNLLTNAVKFTPTGGFVSLTWEATAADVRISVTDTGIGIAPENLERVFEPYVRIADGDKAERGAGLGLSISQKLAHAMGATITVTSRAEAGSTFTLVLPRGRRGPADAAHRQRRDAGLGGSILLHDQVEGGRRDGGG